MILRGFVFCVLFLVDQLQLVATECIIDEGPCHHNRTANGAYGKVAGIVVTVERTKCHVMPRDNWAKHLTQIR